MSTIDWMDEKVEHLKELSLAKKYEDKEVDGVFYERGRWHDHSCCPDCCGCEDEFSYPQSVEQYMEGYC